MPLEALVAGVVTVVGGVAAVAAVLDRRVRAQVDAWRGLAEARGEETHDCQARLDRIEAELEVIRGSWFQTAAAEIAARVEKILRDERA